MSLDIYLYELSNLFLLPVQIGVVLLFLYAVFSLGAFITLYAQRKLTQHRLHTIESLHDMTHLRGFSILNLMAQKPEVTREDMEIAAHRELDWLRTTARIAPMLGLVATMIPMGPALKALSDGNVQGISENLIIAFTAVIFALLAASIAFWIASIRKQWLVHDIRFSEQWRENNLPQLANLTPVPALASASQEGNSHAA